MNIIINLNKDYGITSHDAVTAIKKLLKVRKAGHAGTLDPIATGVLLICLNEATKISSLLSNIDKEYIMTAKLGESTDTYDAEGKVIKKFQISNFKFQIEEIKEIIQRFTGEIEQAPPMYSAIKVSGEPLYKLARKGIEIERKPRKVIIYSIEILSFESPFLKLRVSCSKGTYMRSLCNDIGNALGAGAHMVELVRTRIGQFSIENSAKIGELPHKTASLYPIDSALKHLPEIILEGDNLKKAKNGNPITYTPDSPIHPFTISPFIRLKDPEGRLFGIGKVSKGSIKIERLLKL
ncbi:tRNA pseudouridine(55) synthase TruB [Dissulfurispira sp.]|uniref:tRNA pseudouridine(55) synthase TruB n=1 Tax=Dissulfurispira sp. TaxID=2817609 RepID=UPI002FDB21A2